MGAFALLVVLLSACEAVAEFIPDGDPDRRPPGAEATPSPDATPILPNPVFGGTSNLPATAIPDHELARTVVQIRAIDERDDEPVVVRIGSGVIINEDERLILTAYPLVQPSAADGSLAFTTLGIAMAPEAGQEPELMFEAELILADPEAQLAILRVVRDYGEDGLSGDRFTGTQALFDGTATAIAGSGLRIFGHPTPSDDPDDTQPVSMTNASLIGFRSAPGYTGRTWLKTDVRLPHALAGGPVFDQRGVLMGVLVQERYLATGAVGHVRPIDLAREIIEAAVTQPDRPPFEAPVRLHSHVSGGSQVPLERDVWVSQPLFAANANDTITGRDLFDYTNSFPAGLPELYYEFTLAGVPNGATVEERWFLDGLQQDSLSSSYNWDGGPFGYLSDRIIAAGDMGLPRGKWRLEVWVDDQLRARGTALIGEEAAVPEIENPAGGERASTFGAPAAQLGEEPEQILAFFSFTGFESVQQYSWTVFHNNSRVYETPGMAWDYGDNGRTWVGYRSPDGPIASGSWEFEIYADGALVGVVSLEVD